MMNSDINIHDVKFGDRQLCLQQRHGDYDNRRDRCGFQTPLNFPKELCAEKLEMRRKADIN
jgi:hypothetical protein